QSGLLTAVGVGSVTITARVLDIRAASIMPTELVSVVEMFMTEEGLVVAGQAAGVELRSALALGGLLVLLLIAIGIVDAAGRKRLE
ncbi:MAG: hypothetical protein FWB72_01035, partial [Firmicutes bacterium]|nr:hypothetical protein [Bacillota bacterium]